MASRREKKREQREKLILQTAAQLVRSAGYANLSMDTLADEVGISKTTLYQHFKSKDDVVTHVLRRAFNNVEQFMQELPTSNRAIARLETMMRYMMQSGYGTDDFPMAMVRDDVFHAFVHDPQISQQFQRMAQAMFQHIDEAKQDGDVDAGIPNDLVLSAMMSLISMAEAGNVWPMNYHRSEIIDQAVRIFLTGVAPRRTTPHV